MDGSGAGNFTINGVTIDYNVNNDSVQNVLPRINASTAGVTASYDRLNDRFSLSNKNSGDLGIAVSEPASGLLAALGLGSSATLVRGKNAQFSIDGGPTLISPGNTFNAAIHGIAGLAMTATSETTETITIDGDNTGARSKIEDFIAKYNAVQTAIEAQTRTTTSATGTVSAATLAGNHEVTDISKQLRNKVFGAVPGLSSSVQRLENLGIDFKSGTNELEIKDSTKLDTALRDHSDDVSTLVRSKPNGLVARIDTFVSNITAATGTLTTQTQTLARQATSLDAPHSPPWRAAPRASRASRESERSLPD